MAKVGDKFVIEIDSVMTNKNGKLYGIKGFKSLVFDEHGLDKLERVCDRDAYMAGYNDGLEIGNKQGFTDAVKDVERELKTMLDKRNIWIPF